MNEELSRTVADLFAKVKRGEDPSSEISRVRDELRKVVQRQDTVFGTFHALVRSFREVIPEEQQRYHAAVKALSTTARLSREDILAAVDRQLEELKILRKALFPSLPASRAELKGMDARSQQIRAEIAKLREKIAFLEQEEKEIAGRMANRQTELTVAEKAMEEVFGDIGSELLSAKKRVEELTPDGAAHPLQTSESAPENSRPVIAGPEQKKDSPRLAPEGAALSQKKCPLCGGNMNFTAEKKWLCSSCSHQEAAKEPVQVKTTEEIKQSIFPDPAPDSEPKKKCPMCGGRMDFYLADKKWLCYSCGYEEPGQEHGDVQSGTALQTNTPLEIKESIFPDPAPDSEPKKKCPMCGGGMDYYLAEGKWQCYSCGFEVLQKDEAPGNSKEKAKPTEALPVVSVTEPLFDLPSPARSPRIQRRPPPLKKKSCPGCTEKMVWHEEEKAWRCAHCGYERRI